MYNSIWTTFISHAIEGCSHMTCRACGLGFCWKCRGPCHGGDNILCNIKSIGSSTMWGKATATRTVSKTLAAPVVLTAGGLVVGAAGKGFNDSIGVCIITLYVLDTGERYAA